MSRVGLKPIIIPVGVEFNLKGKEVTIKGPKGSLSLVLPNCIELTQEDKEIKLSVKHPGEKLQRSLWGTFRALLQNLIKGVTEGFSKSLEVNGIGYRANVTGKKIILEVGFSHPVDFPLPEGISALVEKNIVTISGIDKQLVGEVAACFRRIRPPEPYKGTGIKYTTETIRRKAGKAGKAGAA